METFSSNKHNDSSAILSVSKADYFECNICFDSELSEPVVTLCGHLYCWPCIYQWLQYRLIKTSQFSDHHDNHPIKPSCPVCKAEISDALLVPLYGRDSNSRPSCGPHAGTAVPRRPAPPKVDIDSGSYSHDLLFDQESYYNSRPSFGAHDEEQYLAHGHDSAGSETPSYSFLWAAIFGISRNPNSYPPAGDYGARIRIREMRMERSLNRVSFFLFCCLVMCLLFF